MSQFHFRLIILLKLRENERQERQVELAQALEAERIMKDEVESIAAEIAAAKAQVRAALSGGDIPVDSLLELQRYGLHLRVQSAVAAERLAHLRAEVERRRQRLVEANRQVRMLEKLREKQAEAFAFEQLRLEQKVFDEIGQKRIESA
jgi:flagellar FliJ protein